MNAGTLQIELVAEVARLADGMRRAEQLVDKHTTGMARAAATAQRALGAIGVGISVAGFVGFVKNAIDAADQLNKLAQRTSIATEQLSQLQYAAKLSDVSAQTLTDSVRKLNVSIAEGLAGDKKKVETFRALGITQKDLGAGTEAVMMKMATAYSKAADGPGKIAAGNTLMSESAEKMIPFLNQGEEAIRALMKEADSLGLTIDSKFGQQAEAFNDSLTKMREAAGAVAITMGSDFVAGMAAAMTAMADASREGDKLQGIVAGLQTLLTGNDKYKAEKNVVQLTDEYLQLQAKIDEMKAARIPAVVQNKLKVFEAEAARLKVQLDLHRQYLRVLQEQEEAEKKAGGAGGGGPPKPTITVPPVGAGAVSEYQKLIDKIGERVALQEQELRAGRQLTEQEKFAIQILAEAAKVKGGLTAAEKEHVATLLDRAKVQDQALEAQRSELELAKQIAEMRQKQKNTDYDQAGAALEGILKTYQDATKAAKDRVAEMKAENQATELATNLNISLAEAVEMVTVARLEERRALLTEGTEAYQAVQQEIEARRELMGLIRDRETIRAQVDSLREIDRVARDVFNDVSENGVDAFERIGKTIKSAVLDVIYQLTIRPILIQFAGALTGASGSAISQAIGGGASGLMSGAAGSYLGSMLNGGGMFGGVGSALFGSSTAYASVVPGLTATGAGSQAAMLAAQTGEFGLGGLTSTASAGGLGMGTAAAGAAAIGVIALAAVKAWQSTRGEKRGGMEFAYDPTEGTRYVTGPDGSVPEGSQELTAGLLNSTVTSLNEAFKSFGSDIIVKSLQGAWETSTSGRGGVFSGGTLSNGRRFGESGAGSNYDWTGPGDSKYEVWSGALFGGPGGMMPDMDGSPEELATDLQQSYLAALQASVGMIPRLVRQQMPAEAGGGAPGGPSTADNMGGIGSGADAWNKHKTPVYLRVFDEEMKDRARELGMLPKRILDLIIDVDPESLSAEATQELTAKISAMVANVTAFRAAVDAMPVENLRNASFDAAAGLMELQGGIQAFAANLSSYVDNFYSETEKQRFVAGQIQKTLSGAGLNLSVDQILATSRDTFRSIMETLAPDSPLYSALLSVNAQFASIAPAAEAAADSLQETQRQLAGMGEGVFNFVRELKASRGGTASPQQLLAGTRSAYLQDLALAKKNDPDALGRITSSAQAYIEAQKGYTASGGATQAVINQVIAEMSKLPAVKSYEQQMLEALKKIDTSVNKLPPGFGTEIAQKFSQLDLDGSGGLTFAELKQALGDKATDAQLRAIFKELDVNGDGTISRLESLKGQGASQVAWLTAINSSVKSMGALVAGSFEAIDVDVSGAVNFAELKSFFGPLATDAQIKALIKIADADKNGSLTKLELINATIAATKTAVTAADNANTNKTISNDNTRTSAEIKVFQSSNAGGYAGDAAGFAGGGVHTGGWRWVGERGPELEYTGPSRIYSHHDSMRMVSGGGGGGDDGLREEVRQLRAAVDQQTRVIQAGARGTIDGIAEVAGNTRESARAIALRGTEAPV